MTIQISRTTTDIEAQILCGLRLFFKKNRYFTNPEIVKILSDFHGVSEDEIKELINLYWKNVKNTNNYYHIIIEKSNFKNN